MAKTKRPAVHVTMACFDARADGATYRPKRVDVPIGEFKPMTMRDYAPRGATPLRDATASFIGQLRDVRAKDRVAIGLLLDESGSMSGNEGAVVESVNKFVDGMRATGASPDAAGTVIAVVVTDGEENASHEVDARHLAAMVAQAERDGFTFIFLGANIDAWHAGTSMGLSGSATGQSVNYVSTPVGVANAMASVTYDVAAAVSNPGEYVMRRNALGSMRSLAEDGTESYVNTGGTFPTATPAPPVVTNVTYGNVDAALRTVRGEDE